MSAKSPADESVLDRATLRQRLLAERRRFADGPDAAAGGRQLARHLCQVLTELEPELLGLHWPFRSEFNAIAAVADDKFLVGVSLALPFAQRSPVRLEYRAWNGLTPALRDECGIPSSDGAAVVPDVIVVPCVGFTAEGYRLGYGGGYFDRWLALHPQTTTVGVAWSFAALGPGVFQALDHDRPMTVVVTERGVN